MTDRKRKQTDLWTTFAAVAALAAGMPGAAEAAGVPAGRAPRPNVVLIVADDLGWNGVGYHGGFAPDATHRPRPRCSGRWP